MKKMIVSMLVVVFLMVGMIGSQTVQAKTWEEFLAQMSPEEVIQMVQFFQWYPGDESYKSFVRSVWYTYVHVKQDIAGERIIFRDITFNKIDFSDFYFEGVLFDRVIANDCNFDRAYVGGGCSFTGCQFNGGSIKGLKASRAYFTWGWRGEEPIPTVFNGGILSFSRHAHLDMYGVEFYATDVQDFDISENREINEADISLYKCAFMVGTKIHPQVLAHSVVNNCFFEDPYILEDGLKQIRVNNGLPEMSQEEMIKDIISEMMKIENGILREEVDLLRKENETLKVEVGGKG